MHCDPTSALITRRRTTRACFNTAAMARTCSLVALGIIILAFVSSGHASGRPSRIMLAGPSSPRPAIGTGSSSSAADNATTEELVNALINRSGNVTAPNATTGGRWPTVYAYCLGHGYLSRFTRLINVSKSDETVAKLLDPTFNGTVFLPVDRGFAKARGLIVANLGLDFFDLFENSTAAARLVKNHIIPGARVRASQLTSNTTLFTALGEPLTAGISSRASNSGAYEIIRYVQTPSLQGSQEAFIFIADTNIPAGAALVHEIGGVLVSDKP